MVCTAPAGFSGALAAPYVNAARLWAQGVEMQLALTRYWFDMATLMNPMMPALDVHKLAKPHPAGTVPAPGAKRPAMSESPAAPEEPIETAPETVAPELAAPEVKTTAEAAPETTTPAAATAPVRAPKAAPAAPKAAGPARRRKKPSLPEAPFSE